jgi:hypothetical protein
MKNPINSLAHRRRSKAGRFVPNSPIRPEPEANDFGQPVIIRRKAVARRRRIVIAASASAYA